MPLPSLLPAIHKIMKDCPPPGKIAAYLMDELPAGESQGIAIHVEQCSKCERVMDGLVEELALGDARDEQPKSESIKLVGPNLLIGLLALQNGFVSRAQLVAATSDWLEDKKKNLAEILVKQNSLSIDERNLLEQLVSKHLASHDNDVEKSLVELGSTGILKTELKSLNDPDVEASLDLLPTLDSQPDTEQIAQSSRRTYGEQDRFKQVRSHAKGGLGEVFVAIDQQLDRQVALKRIQGRLADSQFARLRFEQEAEVTGKLEHPGIVPVYALGADEGGRPFYAMRFIKGRTLKDEIADFHEEHGRQSWRTGTPRLHLQDLVNRLIDVCNTMEYAHHRGILHRDLKPDNVMLGKFGETIVVDWGLAKKAGAVLPSDARPDLEESIIRPDEGSDSTPTTVGTVVGTLGYMSPEQASGRNEDIGPPSDVYGLGAILYRMLTDQTSQDLSLGKVVVLRRIEAGEVLAPQSINSNVPPPLEAICVKAMATDAGDRYQTARSLAKDLARWMAEEKVGAHKETISEQIFRLLRRYRGPFAVVFALSLAAVSTLSATQALFYARVARQEQKDAERKVETVSGMATQIVDAWVSGPAEELKNHPGSDEFRHSLLSSAVDWFDELASEATSQPPLELERARTRIRLGKGFLDIGDLPSARTNFVVAKSILRSHVLQASDLRTEVKFEITNCEQLIARIENAEGAAGPSAFQQPIDKLKELISENPDSVEYRQAYAAALVQRGNAWLGSAQFERTAEDASVAIEQLQKLLTSQSLTVATSEILPLLSESRSLIGYALMSQQRPDEAEDYFQRAIDFVPASTDNPVLVEARADARSYLCVIYRQSGRVKKELYQTALRRQEYQELCDASDAVRLQASLARTWMDEGQLWLIQGDAHKANLAFQNAVRMYREHNGTRPLLYREELAASRDSLALSHLMLDEANRGLPLSLQAVEGLRSSVAELEKAMEKEVDEELASTWEIRRQRLNHRLAVSLVQQGLIHDRLKNFEDSTGAFQEAIRLLDVLTGEARWSGAATTYQATQAVAYDHYGHQRRRTGSGGLAELRKAGALWEQVASVSAYNQNEYGRFLVSVQEPSMRDPQRAAEMAESALKAAPNNPNYLATLAAAQFQLGELDLALNLIESAKEKRGNEHPFDQLIRTMAILKRGDLELARETFDVATTKLAETMPGDRRLENLRADAERLLQETSSPQ